MTEHYNLRIAGSSRSKEKYRYILLLYFFADICTLSGFKFFSAFFQHRFHAAIITVHTEEFHLVRKYASYFFYHILVFQIIEKKFDIAALYTILQFPGCKSLIKWNCNVSSADNSKITQIPLERIFTDNAYIFAIKISGKHGSTHSLDVTYKLGKAFCFYYAFFFKSESIVIGKFTGCIVYQFLQGRPFVDI